MKKIILIMLRIYKKLVSPLLVSFVGHGCRFSPTCSKYAEVAIEKHGIFKGFKLSLLRFAKCHPFSKSSYFDPVPEM